MGKLWPQNTTQNTVTEHIDHTLEHKIGHLLTNSYVSEDINTGIETVEILSQLEQL